MKAIARRITAPTVVAIILASNGFVNLATGLVGVFEVPAPPGLDAIPQYVTLAPRAHISGLLSVFLGLLLVALGRGIYERRRRSWAVSLVVLAVLMTNNLYRGTTPYTVIVSLLVVAGLLVFRKDFNVRTSTKLDYAQAIAWVSILFALGYGIVGSYALRAQFTGLETWTDAIYFTFVTYSTLGYGDILPKTPNARMFVVSMIPIGLASVITALTAVVGPLIEKRVKGVLRIMKRFHKTNHVIICGYSSVSESAIDELRGRGVPYVIVDDRKDLVLHIASKGHDVIGGDATKQEILDQANLRSAVAVMATFDADSVNLLIAITAKALRDTAKGCRCRIIVRIEDEENVKKATGVGADEVVSPSTIAGRLMVAQALRQDPA